MVDGQRNSKLYTEIKQKDLNNIIYNSAFVLTGHGLGFFKENK